MFATRVLARSRSDCSRGVALSPWLEPRARSDRRPPLGAPAVPLRDPEALSGVESLTRGPARGRGVPRGRGAGAPGRGAHPRPRGAGAQPAAEGRGSPRG